MAGTMKSMKCCGKKWFCVQPGLWRSECGWYEVVRTTATANVWCGCGLDRDKRGDVIAFSLKNAMHILIYGPTMRKK